MDINQAKYFCFAGLLHSMCVSAQLVSEDEITQWGYSTIEYKISNLESYVIETQTIKSANSAPGLEDHYYYYTLSQECFSNRFAAIKRKASLLFLDEKEYILSDLSGHCVRSIETSANFATFEEQPRVFELFKKYLDKSTSSQDVK